MALDANALTTLEAVRDELNVSASSQFGVLERLINVASTAIERHCNRQFGLATTTEKLVGYGGSLLRLSRSPIVSVAEVRYRGQVVTGWEIASEELSALHHPAGWAWTAPSVAQLGHAQTGGLERFDYQVTYTAGFRLPADAARNLPADIEEACILAVVAAYRGRGRDPGIVAQSAGGASVTYASASRPAGSLPDASKALLAGYRRTI